MVTTIMEPIGLLPRSGTAKAVPAVLESQDGENMINSLYALNAVNFFMADVRDGLGPFLGVFLQQKGWSPAAIGLAMSIGGYAGMLTTAPLGALVDATDAKRTIMVASALVICGASMAILFVPSFAATSASQIATGIAGAAIVPAMAGITLGLVKQAGYAHQLGRNEAFNHAGNVFAALAGGGLGYLFGLQAVFYTLAAMALASVVAVLAIDPRDIDNSAARGLAKDRGATQANFAALLTCKPLIGLAATLALFHLANAAMLPLLGQAIVARGAGDPSVFTAATVVVAQIAMIPMALLAARLAKTRGYRLVLLLALIALPIRGMIAALVGGAWGLLPVQILDGVGAGLLGVATPGLTARILEGTGRINVGLGAVMTAQAIGAASSPALAGMIAGRLGYSAAFLTLAAIAVAALVMWVVLTPVMTDACDPGSKPASAPQTARAPVS